MRVSRGAILIILGILTLFFLGSSYALWFNDDLIPPSIRNGEFATPLAAATARNGYNQSKAVRITVKETGIVAIKAKDLRNAGLTFEELSPKTFELTINDRQVPFMVRQEAESATLYFYGQANENPDEPLSVYILRPGVGEAITERDATPEGPGVGVGYHHYKWEEDRFFVGQAGGEDSWMGPLLMAPGTWSFNLNDIQVEAAPAELTIHLFSNREGSGDPDHHVEIQINDQTIAEHSWDGIKHEIITVPLIEGILTGSENTINVLLQDNSNISAETIYINELELAYQGPISARSGQVDFLSDAENIEINDVEDGLVIFDISDNNTPINLKNFDVEKDSAQFAGNNKLSEYIAANQSVQVAIEPVPAWANSLHDTNWEADYIAIVADVNGFDEALAPLLQYRKDEGMRVLPVPLEQIYDEFGAGHKSPTAIKAFLAYAAAHWTPPTPRYVLLVGDATYDLTDQSSGKNRNRLPTPLIHTDTGGFVANDSWYGRFTGGLPPMAIGRFPAQNAPQLRVMVAKTLAYEQQSTAEDIDWRKRALLVADDESVFDEATLSLSNKLVDNGYRVYRLQMSYSERIHYNIISAINQGVGLVNYFGDGSSGTWGDEDVLQNSDAQALQNSARLPILTSFTTLNGAFAEPRIDTLAESLLRANDGGVVAAVAPSGRANREQLLFLSEQFYSLLLQQDGSRLGDILDNMISSYATDQAKSDALITVNILGDPALRFYAP